MEWIPLNKKSAMPEGEVLAGNFGEGTFGYKEVLVGYLLVDRLEVWCESDTQMLLGVTHYIDIHKFPPTKQPNNIIAEQV